MSPGTLLAFAGLGSVIGIGIYGFLYYGSKRRKRRTCRSLLSTRDSLTGLIHYDVFLRQLERLLRTQSRAAVAMVDCSSVKEAGQNQNEWEENQILRQTAELLDASLPSPKLIACYGRDEFAIAFSNIDDERLEEIKRFFHVRMAKQTVVQSAYGISVFPDDGTTHEQLVQAAAADMTAMKRELRLKRENQIAQAEKLRVMGELASGMAHEIRNPLTTIKGFIQLSRTYGYNIEPWYDMIMDEINRMSVLTSEFLRFSKPMASDFKQSPVHTCIQRVVSLTESEISRLGHRLQYHCTEPALEVKMDQDKIVQLLLNLVKNAMEAMPEQGEVTIRLLRSENWAIIEVTDTGIGMSDDELGCIFQPFYTSKEEGTGLGLPICHKIAQDHGGRIEVESKKMNGTTFRVAIPLPEPSEVDLYRE